MEQPLEERAAGARSLAQALLDNADADLLAALAQAAARLTDFPAQQGVLSALRQLPPERWVDTLWQVWQATRSPALEGLLLGTAVFAGATPELAALSRLKLGRLELLWKAGPEVVEPLLALCSDPDAEVGPRALRVLGQLQNPAAQDELCRWVIEHDSPSARQAALAGGYAPQAPQERALFFLLTGQWERYEALDFDSRLLQAVYAVANEDLRRQIARAARQSGWSGFVQAVAGARTQRRLDSLSDFEWEALLLIVGREARWAEAWQLAQVAPARWSARLLRLLHESPQAWQPAEDSERQAYLHLAALALQALQAGPPQPYRVRHLAALYGHTRQITAVALLPGAEPLAATASADKTVRLWQLGESHSGQRLLQTLQAHNDFALALAVAPDGSWLASAGADKVVRLWSLPDGRLLQELSGHAGRVTHLAVTPDGALLASADERSIHLWRMPEGVLIQAIRGQHNGLNSLAITAAEAAEANRYILVSGDSERVVRLWDLPGGELRRTILTPIVGWTLSASLTPSRFGEEPEGKLERPQAFLASSSSFSSLQLWRLPDGELLRNLPGRANTSLLALSPDAHWLACADRANVLVWDLQAEAAPPFLLKGGAALTSALAFSPDSRLLVAGSQERLARLWLLPENSAAEAQKIALLEGYTGPVRHLAFHPNGRLLVSADETSLRLWALDDLSELTQLPPLQTRPELLQAGLDDPTQSPAQRAWLSLALELGRWQRRFDIELAEPGRSIPLGDFDIEIEWPT